MSDIKGYRTGGSIHFVVNNQIGFTTSPAYSRTSPYPSDVALMVQAPILHVNGDDPEAVTHVARIAMEYRQRFAKDVVIDMFCYRRFGHNEGDDPTMTQPLMYRAIKDHPSVRDLYVRRLVAEGVVGQAEADGWVADFQAHLQSEFDAAKDWRADKADWLDGKWSHLALPGDEERRGATAVPLQRLKELGLACTSLPASLDVHRTVRRVIDARHAAIETGQGIDWSTAEHLAFASLLDQGVPVRLSGQDSVRGTFVQRHSDIIDQTTEAHYQPLSHLRPGQAHFEALDSALSEEAVLGFEYGFSVAEPNTLTLWEAQFGDFANGAQVVIDQFIAAGERKWLRMSGLGLLLPHGYEGQGPEHSSARLERYLQLCAEDNLQVVNCTTPANYFHVLRRQMVREFRKPLIVMTPKSLLRHKKAVSALADMAEGSSFHRVLHDDAQHGRHTPIRLKSDDRIRRVVLCSGKVYYDLLEAREKTGARRHISAEARAVLSVADEVSEHRTGALRQGSAGVVPGGAKEHGRLDVRRSVAGADPRQARHRRQAGPLCGPPRFRLHRGRPPEPASEGTRHLARSRLRAMTDILTPILGESVTEATVARWIKKAGESVKRDEILVELETDKVGLEVAAPEDGTLSEIAAADGAVVKPGELLGRIGPASGIGDKPPSKTAAPPLAESAQSRRPP